MKDADYNELFGLEYSKAFLVLFLLVASISAIILLLIHYFPPAARLDQRIDIEGKQKKVAQTNV